MEKAGELYIDIKADLGDLKAQLGELNKTLQKTGDEAEKSAGGIKELGLQAAAIGIAFAGIIASGKKLVSAYAESEKSAAKLNAVIKSTGSAAGVTADEINTLASSLQKTTAYEDDAIVSANALLLTFTNIGKDIIPQTNEAILDLSAALGQDLQTSARMVGSALDNPVESLGKLSRVGVKFSESQEGVIKSLVESGKLLDAQNIILGELEKKFGGTAEAIGNTFDGAVSKLNNNLGDTQEIFGKIIADSLKPLLTGVNNLVVGFNGLITGLQEISPLGSAFLNVLTAAAFIIPSVALATKGYAVAQGLFNVAMSAGAISIKAFTTAVASNPIGLAITGVALATVGILSYIDAQNKSKKATDESNKSVLDSAAAYDKAKNQLSGLTKLQLNNTIIEQQKSINSLKNSLNELGITTKEVDSFFDKSGKLRKDLTKDEADALDIRNRLITAQQLYKAATESLNAIENDSIKKIEIKNELSKEQEKILQSQGELRKELELQTLEGIDRELVALDQKRQKQIADAFGDKALLTQIDKNYLTEKEAIEYEYYTKTRAFAEDQKQYEIETLDEKKEIFNGYFENLRINMESNIDGFAGYVGSLTNNVIENVFSMVDTISIGVKTGFNNISGTITSIATAIASTLSGISNATGQILSDIYGKQLSEAKNLYAKEKELIENNGKTKEQNLKDQLKLAIETNDLEKASQIEKDLKILESEKKLAFEEFKIKRDQFYADQALASVNAGIAFALGTIQAWASSMMLGPIAGPIAGAALTTVLGSIFGVQLGLILSKTPPSMPAYANGGFVNGISKYKDSTGVLAKSGELMLNGEQQRSLFDRINNNEYNNSMSIGQIILPSVQNARDFVNALNDIKRYEFARI